MNLVRRRDRSAADDHAEFVAQVHSDLADDLPDEDLTEDLADCLDLYEMGSKPRCEEVEYLAMIREAVERIERGR